MQWFLTFWGEVPSNIWWKLWSFLQKGSCAHPTLRVHVLQARSWPSHQWAGCAGLWVQPLASSPRLNSWIPFWLLLLGVDVSFPSKCRNKGDVLFHWLQFESFSSKKVPKGACILGLIPGWTVLGLSQLGRRAQQNSALCNQLCQCQHHDYRNQHQTLNTKYGDLLLKLQWNFNSTDNTQIPCCHETVFS